MQQIYKRTSHPFLCNFNKITLRHGCSPVSILHIFRTSFSNNTFGLLLDQFQCTYFQSVFSHENKNCYLRTVLDSETLWSYLKTWNMLFFPHYDLNPSRNDIYYIILSVLIQLSTIHNLHHSKHKRLLSLLLLLCCSDYLHDLDCKK